MRWFVFSLFFASTALAHGDQAASEALYWQDGELMALRTNRGLLTRRDGVLSWSCLPAAEPGDRTVHYDEAAGWLVAAATGLQRSIDGGCSWQTVAGPLATMTVRRFRSHPDGLLLAAQNGDDGARLFRFDGDGFVPFGDALPDGALEDLTVRPEGLLALVQPNRAAPNLLRADAAGRGWQTVLPLTAWAGPRFVALDFGDGGPVISAIKQGGGELLTMDHGAWVKRARLPAPVASGVSAEGEHWLLTTMGLALHAESDGPFLAEEGPQHCLDVQEGQLLSCADLGDGFLMRRRRDGAWQPSGAIDGVVRSHCAPPACDADWAVFEALLPTETPDPAPPPRPAGGCGCGAFDPCGLLVLVLLVLRRARAADA